MAESSSSKCTSGAVMGGVLFENSIVEHLAADQGNILDQIQQAPYLGDKAVHVGLVAVGLDIQGAAVFRQLQAGVEQVQGAGLGVGDPLLQQVLAGGAGAELEKCLALLDQQLRLQLEADTHDPVALEKTAQHSVGGERFDVVAQRLKAVVVPGQGLLPVRVDAVQVGGYGLPELVLFEKEEIELEHVAELEGGGPEGLQGGVAVPLAGGHQGHLGDGRIEEVVNDGVAVKGGRHMLIPVNGVH